MSSFSPVAVSRYMEFWRWLEPGQTCAVAVHYKHAVSQWARGRQVFICLQKM